MEFAEVGRRRHMVRAFAERTVPRDVLDPVIDAGRRAPSAGFSQGCAFVVLEGPGETGPFWELTAPDGVAPTRRWERLRVAPVLVLPLANRQAYVDRYAEDDKAGRGVDGPDRWRVPYWLVDTAFATMTVLLAATDAGLGALFFALGGGEAELLRHLDVPDGYEPIGAVALGWPAEDDAPSRSTLRGRRDRSDTVHYGRWGTGA